MSSGAPLQNPAEERAAWELAAKQLLANAWEEGRTVANVQIAGAAAKGQSRIVARANALIQRIWREANAPNQAGGSRSSEVEAAYLYAVDLYAERFSAPQMGPPSSLIVQQALLLGLAPHEAEAVDCGDAAIQCEIDLWNAERKSRFSRLDAKLEPSQRTRLRELCKSPAARTVFEFLQLLSELVDTSEFSLEQISHILAQHQFDQALKQAALANSARYIGEEGDPSNRGSLGEAVEQALLGDAFRTEPGITDGEPLTRRMAECRMLWEKFIQQVRRNDPFKTRHQNLSEGLRAHLYNKFTKRLAQAWIRWHDEQAQPWAFFDALSNFLDVCETRWHAEIHQLLEGAAGQPLPQFLPLLTVRNARRQLLHRSDLTGVHEQVALRQRLNDSMALGYRPEELGLQEAQHNFEITAVAAEEILRSVNRSPAYAEKIAYETWNGLTPDHRDAVIAFLRDSYRRALNSGLRPLFLADDDLVEVRLFQKNLRQESETGPKPVVTSPPVSTITGRALLNENDVQQLRSLANADRRNFERKIDALITDAEVEEFDRLISKRQGLELSSFGMAVWLGLQGLVELKEPWAAELVSAAVSEGAFKFWRRVLNRHWQNGGRFDNIPRHLWAPPGFFWAIRPTLLGYYSRNPEDLKRAPLEVRGDFDFFEDLVSRDAWALQYAVPDMKDNERIVLAAARRFGWAISWASERLRNDDTIVLAAVQQRGLVLEYASQRLRNDDTIVLAAVQQDGLALQYASKRLRDDERIVLAAVRQNGLALQYASSRLKNDPAIVRAAVQQRGLALEHASKRLRNDFDTLLAAVQQDCLALQHASEWAQDHAGIVREVVPRNGWAVRYVSERLKNDPTIVGPAVRQNGLALEFASGILKNSPIIVRAAVRQNGLALGYASHELKNDSGIVLSAVEQNGLALEYASQELQDDPTIVLAAVRQNGMALQYASERLRSDQAIVLAALQQNGMALRYVAPYLRRGGAIVTVALEQNGMALESASDGHKNDPTKVLAALQQNGMALEHASERLKDDPAIVLAAVQQNGEALRYASERLKNDPAIVLAAVQQNGQALRFASYFRRDDPAIVRAAVLQNGYALRYATMKLRGMPDLYAAAGEQIRRAGK